MEDTSLAKRRKQESVSMFIGDNVRNALGKQGIEAQAIINDIYSGNVSRAERALLRLQEGERGVEGLYQVRSRLRTDENVAASLKQISEMRQRVGELQEKNAAGPSPSPFQQHSTTTEAQQVGPSQQQRVSVGNVIIYHGGAEDAVTEERAKEIVQEVAPDVVVEALDGATGNPEVGE